MLCTSWKQHQRTAVAWAYPAQLLPHPRPTPVLASTSLTTQGIFCTFRALDASQVHLTTPCPLRRRPCPPRTCSLIQRWCR